jgi:hypothetical protein
MKEGSMSLFLRGQNNFESAIGFCLDIPCPNLVRNLSGNRKYEYTQLFLEKRFGKWQHGTPRREYIFKIDLGKIRM